LNARGKGRGAALAVRLDAAAEGFEGVDDGSGAPMT